MGSFAEFIKYGGIQELLSVAVSVITAVAATASVFFGARQLRSGASKEGQISPAQIQEIERSDHADTKPFEITALAGYYNQALSRSNVSFWFSLVFASIGFVVIIIAFTTHQSGDLTGTIVKLACGIVIDAVSSLFFVQSTNAQRNMSEFFEKLRLDRLNAEARDMIGEIEDSVMRDQLRAQLILKYSGVENLLTGSNLISGILPTRP